VARTVAAPLAAAVPEAELLAAALDKALDREAQPARTTAAPSATAAVSVRDAREEVRRM
jgi:hypothetical protein